MATAYIPSYADQIRQRIHEDLQNSISNPHWNQLNQATYNQQLANLQSAMNQQAAYAQGQQNYTNYLQQLAQAHPQIARPAQIIEEVEEKVVKEVYKAAFDMHRFFEKLMHWPIGLLDWSVGLL